MSKEANLHQETPEANKQPLMSGFLVFNRVDLPRIRESLRARLMAEYPNLFFSYATEFTHGQGFFGLEVERLSSFVLLVEGEKEANIDEPEFTKFQIFKQISDEFSLKPLEFLNVSYGLITTVPQNLAITFKKWGNFEGDLFSFSHHRHNLEPVFPAEFLTYAKEVSTLPQVKGLRVQRARDLGVDILLNHDSKRDLQLFLKKLDEIKKKVGFKIEVDSEFIAIGSSGNNLFYIPNIQRF